MAETVYGMTKELLDAVRALIRESKEAGPLRSYESGPDREEQQASDTYLAISPVGGIPGRSGAVPGSADCDLYKIIVEDDERTLEQIPETFKTVVNMSVSEVPANLFILITKDKGGTWYVSHIFWEIGTC